MDTAILLIDPYNDFLHVDGKLYSRLADDLVATNTIHNLLLLVRAARQTGMPIFYGLHQQTTQHMYKGWQAMTASQKGLQSKMVFEEGTWGAQIFEGMEPDFDNGDVIVAKHWNSSSFHNTDFDYQLRQRGIKKVIIAGLIANTCVESTARYAYEHSYEVTMLSDATAGFTSAAKEAAVKLIWPLFAKRVLTTQELIHEIAATD